MKTSFVPALAALMITATVCEAADNMKAFPAPEAGTVRFVLHLPKATDETAMKVELQVGKTVEVDAANRHFFGGAIQEETIDGWGFTLYRLRQLGPMAGTLMAVDPGVPKVSRFVTLGGEPFLIRYNSRLPVVVYVPKGVEVRHRIWTAGTKFVPLQQG